MNLSRCTCGGQPSTLGLLSHPMQYKVKCNGCGLETEGCYSAWDAGAAWERLVANGNEDMKVKMFDFIRKDADENGMVCIQDSFGISGMMVRAEDLIEYLVGLGK